MIDRLKCCIYILFAKQYIVFTDDKYTTGWFRFARIKAKRKEFLQTAMEFIEHINSTQLLGK